VGHHFSGAAEKHALILVTNANNGQPASLLKEASEVDRLQLKQFLQAAGVPEDSYLLVGLDPPKAVREGACIVRPNQRSWEVLMWQPASRPWSRIFLNQDLACGYALDVLTSSAARRPLAVVDGPADVAPSPATALPAAPAVLSAVAGKPSLQV
jgi:hypothetical protein